MFSKSDTIKLVIKKEGFFSLLKRALRRYIFSFFYLPFCFSKIKNLKYDTIDEVVDFAFNDCRGYLAPMQVKSEISGLLKFLKKNKPKTIMEIGTARGGTLLLFSKVIPEDASIITIDLPGGGYPWWKKQLYESFTKKNQNLQMFIDNSHETKTFEKVKATLGVNKIDFLFIDGDHSYDGVKKDFESYKKLVRKSGIIAFHDIVPHPKETKCDVHLFWKEIKNKYKHYEFVEDWNQQWGGIGAIVL